MSRVGKAKVEGKSKSRQFREPPLGHVGFVWGWKPSFIIVRLWAFEGPMLFLCRSTPPKKSKALPQLDLKPPFVKGGFANFRKSLVGQMRATSRRLTSSVGTPAALLSQRLVYRQRELHPTLHGDSGTCGPFLHQDIRHRFLSCLFAPAPGQVHISEGVNSSEEGHKPGTQLRGSSYRSRKNLGGGIGRTAAAGEFHTFCSSGSLDILIRDPFTASPHTKNLEFQGFDSVRFLLVRGGILRARREDYRNLDSEVLNLWILSIWTGHTPRPADWVHGQFSKFQSGRTKAPEL